MNNSFDNDASQLVFQTKSKNSGQRTLKYRRQSISLKPIANPNVNRTLAERMTNINPNNPNQMISFTNLPKKEQLKMQVGLPLRILDFYKNPIDYSTDHLKKCFLLALKELSFTNPIKFITKKVLAEVFEQFQIEITRLHLEEAFFFAVFSLDPNPSLTEMDDDEVLPIEPLHGKSKKNLGNLSMDQKDRPAKTNFNLSKFVIWLKKNLHKLKNVVPKAKENKEAKNVNTSADEIPGIGEPQPEPKIKLSEKKIQVAKALKNRHYWDLKTMIDQEKNFRAKSLVSWVKDMGLDEEIALMNPQHLLPVIRSHVNWPDEDKKYCEWGVKKLKEMNTEIFKKLSPIVEEVNKGRPVPVIKKKEGGSNSVIGTILSSYKKKLEDDELASKKYAAMAKARLKQRRLEKEFQTNLEMSAILQEQESALGAARLYELMCDDRMDKELKNFKGSLNNAEQRRVRRLMKEY